MSFWTNMFSPIGDTFQGMGLTYDPKDVQNQIKWMDEYFNGRIPDPNAANYQDQGNAQWAALAELGASDLMFSPAQGAANVQFAPGVNPYASLANTLQSQVDNKTYNAFTGQQPASKIGQLENAQPAGEQFTPQVPNDIGQNFSNALGGAVNFGGSGLPPPSKKQNIMQISNRQAPIQEVQRIGNSGLATMNQGLITDDRGSMLNGNDISLNDQQLMSIPGNRLSVLNNGSNVQAGKSPAQIEGETMAGIDKENAARIRYGDNAGSGDEPVLNNTIQSPQNMSLDWQTKMNQARNNLKGMNPQRNSSVINSMQYFGPQANERFAGQQNALADMLRQTASGQGPSVGTESLKAGMARSRQNLNSLAASTVGMNPALKAKQFLGTQRQMEGDVTQNSGILRAQEALNAQSQLGNVLNQGRQGDLSQAGLNVNYQQGLDKISSDQAKINLADQAQKDEQISKMMGMGVGMNEATRAANMQYDQDYIKKYRDLVALLTNQYGAASNAESQSSAANAGLVGSILAALV